MSGIGHNSDNGAGFYLAGRDMRFHPVVGCGKPMKPADPSHGAWSRFEAWHDLIALARYKEGKVEDKGYARTLQAGQLLGGQDYLSKRWNWTRQTVRTFLLKLERECMIAIFCSKKPNQQKGNLTNVISVTKYAPYQFESAWNNQQINQPTTSEQPASNQRATRPKQSITQENNNNITSARELPDFSYGADDFQLDDKKRLTLVNGERATWVDCFGGKSEALDIALRGFTPEPEYTGRNTLAKHARHYLNQQAQAFNRAERAGSTTRSKTKSSLRKAMENNSK